MVMARKNILALHQQQWVIQVIVILTNMRIKQRVPTNIQTQICIHNQWKIMVKVSIIKQKIIGNNYKLI